MNVKAINQKTQRLGQNWVYGPYPKIIDTSVSSSVGRERYYTSSRTRIFFSHKLTRKSVGFVILECSDYFTVRIPIAYVVSILKQV